MRWKTVGSWMLLFLAFTLGMGSPGLAAENMVTVATLRDYSPYCFAKENAETQEEELIPPGKDSIQLQGYSWDIVRESFHSMGYTINLSVVPWSRGMKMAENGRTENSIRLSQNGNKSAVCAFYFFSC